MCTAVGTLGPGKPLEGQTKGCPSVPMRVYSCSIPNQGTGCSPCPLSVYRCALNWSLQAFGCTWRLHRTPACGVLVERVPKHGSRDKIHVTVGPFRLKSARAIRIPLRRLFYTLGFRIQGSGLAVQSFSSTVDPDVHSLDFSPWGRAMYTCLMPLFKWELAKVAMVEGVLGAEQSGRASRRQERGKEKRGRGGAA